MNWPFHGLTHGHYGLILVDLPKRFATWSAKGQGKSPSQHYACMDWTDLVILPVAGLAARNSALVMWAQWEHLKIEIGLMEAWGFAYKTGGCWAKRSETGRKWAFSTGYTFRGACEPFLYGTRGSPKRASRSERNLIEAPVREHSRKPEEMHAVLERLFPDVPKCELFGRQSRPGWEVWGHEATKFDMRSSEPRAWL
jgi:N6-adenosine-specific RNA methylase IME4